MLEEIKIEVTDLCYRNCIHCSTQAVTNEPKHQELSIEKVKTIIEEAAKMNFSSVVFTGGEATLWSSLKEAIQYAKDQGLKTKLYTMCCRNNENITLLKELNDVGLDEIIYSTATELIADTPKDEISLEKFINLLKSATKQNLRISFHHVITNKTKENIYDIAKLTYENTLDNKYQGMLSFLRYVPHGRGDKQLALTKEDMKILRDDLIKLKDIYGDYIRIGSPHNILNIEHTPCTAAQKTMIVGVDGRIYPCDATKYFSYIGLGGNIFQNSLQETYDSEYFKNIRKYKDHKGVTCKKCQNQAICNSGCLGQKMITGFSDDNQITFSWYEKNAKRTMVPLENKEDILFNAETGLFGETGELVDAIKKWGSHNLNEEAKEKTFQTMTDEIGDVMWYIAASLSSYHNLSLNEIAENIFQKKKITQPKEINSQLISHFSELQDPQCPNLIEEKEYSIAELDTMINNNNEIFDLKNNWKKEIFVNLSHLLQANTKEEVIEAASNYIVVLTKLCNKVLNKTMEEILITNIERLKERYENGFDTTIAENRVAREVNYVITNISESNKIKEKLL